MFLDAWHNYNYLYSNTLLYITIYVPFTILYIFVYTEVTYLKKILVELFDKK